VIAGVLLLGICLFLSWGLFGQLRDKDEPPRAMTLRGMSTQDLQLLRQDIRYKKQKRIVENLPVTESEAIKFWMVYQKYAAA
jgi:hypothetical protein